MDQLYSYSQQKISKTKLDFVRFLMDKIDWKQRLIGITGARGCGKTTLMLQRIKVMNLKVEEVLYISLDNIHLVNKPLFLIADEFAKMGGRYLFLDEVHKYPNWSSDIKNIYDLFPELQIVFTGSSVLDIYKGSHDLSRRAIHYKLPGLSLREFIEFEYGIKIKESTLEDILFNQADIANDINKRIKPLKVFNEYLRNGYYPFYQESKDNYSEKLLNTINLVIETDLPGVFAMDFRTVLKIKKLLVLISNLVPFTPNIEKLARQIESTRDNLLKQLYYLDKAQIVKWLSKNSSGINFLNKPDKLYLQNTNLAFALSDIPNQGTLRETFFINQLTVNNIITLPKSAGDVLVNGKYLFEIGGKNKNNKQLEGLDKAYIVKDGIEFGVNKTIPLWMFGFIY